MIPPRPPTRAGLIPDMKCYGAAAQACTNGGFSKGTLEIIKRMKADGFVPDKAAYNSAIIACGQNGQWEKALELLGDMRTEDLRPDSNSYRFAMKVSV